MAVRGVSCLSEVIRPAATGPKGEARRRSLRKAQRVFGAVGRLGMLSRSVGRGRALQCRRGITGSPAHGREVSPGHEWPVETRKAARQAHSCTRRPLCELGAIPADARPYRSPVETAEGWTRRLIRDGSCHRRRGDVRRIRAPSSLRAVRGPGPRLAVQVASRDRCALAALALDPTERGSAHDWLVMASREKTAPCSPQPRVVGCQRASEPAVRRELATSQLQRRRSACTTTTGR